MEVDVVAELPPAAAAPEEFELDDEFELLLETKAKLAQVKRVVFVEWMTIALLPK